MSLSRLCRLYGISRQAVYQSEKRRQARLVELEPVKSWIMDIRRFMPRLGTRKLYYLVKPKLESASIKLGRDGLFDYLRSQHMLVEPKRRYTKTTYSHHWMRKHPNLVKEWVPDKPEQLLVSDITYVESKQGVHYLSLTTDAVSRKIMGYEVSDEMKTTDVVKALHMAMKQRQYQRPCIHHSDRGLQYCAALYQEVLGQHDIQPSMTDGYDCYQNALAERINGILKQEFLLDKCNDLNELKKVVEQSITIYNNVRPHLSLGMKTPNQVHNMKKADC